MSSFLIELWSTEKTYTVMFKETNFTSSPFVKSFDMLSKQKLHQIILLSNCLWGTVDLVYLEFIIHYSFCSTTLLSSLLYNRYF